MARDHERTPNDQRSDALNPNSQEHQDSLDNRSVQIRESSEGHDSEDESDGELDTSGATEVRVLRELDAIIHQRMWQLHAEFYASPGPSARPMLVITRFDDRSEYPCFCGRCRIEVVNLSGGGYECPNCRAKWPRNALRHLYRKFPRFGCPHCLHEPITIPLPNSHGLLTLKCPKCGGEITNDDFLDFFRERRSE